MQSVTAIPPVTSPDAAREPGTVDLWWFPYEECFERADLFAAYETLLTDDERIRHERLRFERDRRQFLATRALVRTVLSFYEPAVAPRAWRFLVGDRGKPSIAEPAAGRCWQFNLSNTRGFVVCAVSGVHPRLGVDVERLDRENDLAALADRYFSGVEVAELRSLPEAARPSRFFDYWTLKESYIKAHGLGLAIPLDSFSLMLGSNAPACVTSPASGVASPPNTPAIGTVDTPSIGIPDTPIIGIRFDSRRDDDPARWSFALLDAAPHYRLAIAVETQGIALALRARRFVPLEE
jgi:4'-phosphopantetheinyl transferase